MRKFNQYATILLRKFKVRSRLLFFMITVLLAISSVTILFSHHYAKKIADQYIYEYLQDEHKRLVSNIELYLEEIIMVSIRYKNTIEFYDILQDAKLSYEQKEKALQETALPIRQPVSASIGNIYLVDNESRSYLLRGESAGVPSPDTEIILSTTTAPYYHLGEVVQDKEGSCYLTLSMRFYNFYTFQDMGCLVFYLPQKEISHLYEGLLASSGVTFIADEEGYILSHSDENQVGRDVQDYGIMPTENQFHILPLEGENQDSICVSAAFGSDSQLIGFPLKVYSIIPSDDLFDVLDQILQTISATYVAVIIIAVLISFFLSKRLIRSIKRLHSQIADLSRGKMHTITDPNPRDELWDLEQGYNEMVARIQELLEKNRQEQEKKRELELTALQSQINPHFLYNTLDAIGWIAIMEGQSEIEQMIMALSRFFRLSLHKGDKKITLEDEIHIVESYVTIEQLRNPGEFDVTYDIQPEIMQIMVPKIILQPIVENAIKHGISQVRRHGLIAIQGYRKEDDVFLEVSDNGKGFQKKQTPSPSGGYGLKNVNERIRLEYGEPYGLSFQSVPEEGSTITIHICVESPKKSPDLIPSAED